MMIQNAYQETNIFKIFFEKLTKSLSNNLTRNTKLRNKHTLDRQDLYTHTHIHTLIYIYIHTHTHIHTRTHIHTNHLQELK